MLWMGASPHGTFVTVAFFSLPVDAEVEVEILGVIVRKNAM